METLARKIVKALTREPSVPSRPKQNQQLAPPLPQYRHNCPNGDLNRIHTSGQQYLEGPHSRIFPSEIIFSSECSPLRLFLAMGKPSIAK